MSSFAEDFGEITVADAIELNKAALDLLGEPTIHE